MAALPDLAGSWLKSSSVFLQPQLLLADTVWSGGSKHSSWGCWWGRRKVGAFLPQSISGGFEQGEKKGFLLKTDLRIEAEQGYAERFHLFVCTHLQEITVPVRKGHVPGLNVWAGQAGKE